MNTLTNDKRQKLLIFMCFLIYVASYTSRYSYNANIVAIKEYYDVSNSLTGLVSTCFFFAYGIGQLILSSFCKKMNKRIFLSTPLLISSLINIILFFRPTFVIYKYLWLINGLSLSILWALIMLTLSENLEEKYLSKAVVIMSSTVATGTVITYGCSSLFNLFSGFRYSFLLGSIIAFTVGIIWILIGDKLLTNSYIKEKEEKDNNNKKQKADSIAIITIILFAIFMCIDNLIKDGINTWVPQILKDTFNLGNSLSIILTLVLPLLGLLGAIMAVQLNKIIKDNVLLNGILFLCAGTLITLVLISLNNKLLVPILLSFGLVSLTMHSINGFITCVIPLKLRDKFNSGTLAGVLNGCGYIGSTISAYSLGALADKTGWNGAVILLLSLAFIASLISIIFYAYLKISKKENI